MAWPLVNSREVADASVEAKREIRAKIPDHGVMLPRNTRSSVSMHLFYAQDEDFKPL